MYTNNLDHPEVIRYLNSEVKRHDIINYLIEQYSLVNYLELDSQENILNKVNKNNKKNNGKFRKSRK
jgi:hypothetical protein